MKRSSGIFIGENLRHLRTYSHPSFVSRKGLACGFIRVDVATAVQPAQA
jgi:hypothetical protein